MLALRDLLVTAILAACAGVIARTIGWSPVSVALRCFGVGLAVRVAWAAVHGFTGSAGVALVAGLLVGLTADALLSRVSGEEEDET